MTTVTKEFHFYAAHRNEEIGGKCANIHGHRYGLTVTVFQPKLGSVTILFDEFERAVSPLLSRLDHCLLLHRGDPAANALVNSGACQKIYWLDAPTSAENLAEHIFLRLVCAGLNVVSLTVKETDTSSVTVTA